MKNMNQAITESTLYDYFCKLNPTQFKIFYAILVFCRTRNKSFIAMKKFFKLWCTLNDLCHDLDETFPNQRIEAQALKKYCQAHPYYFIDRLSLEQVAHLFAKYCDQRRGVLVNLLQIIYEQDIQSAYQYVLDTFHLNYSADELAADLERHIKEYNSTKADIYQK